MRYSRGVADAIHKMESYNIVSMRTDEWISSSATYCYKQVRSAVIDTVGSGCLQGLHASLKTHSDGGLVCKSLMETGNLAFELLDTATGAAARSSSSSSSSSISMESSGSTAATGGMTAGGGGGGRAIGRGAKGTGAGPLTTGMETAT
jgi:hypothetical protein